MVAIGAVGVQVACLSSDVTSQDVASTGGSGGRKERSVTGRSQEKLWRDKCKYKTESGRY